MTTLPFGTVVPGDTTGSILELRNLGVAILTGEARVDCPAFAILAGGGSFELAPGEMLEMQMQFVPADTGSYACLLALGTNCGPVSLTGSGRFRTPGAQCVVEPAALDFGPVRIGQQSDRQVKLINTGTVEVVADLVSPCVEFEIVWGGESTPISPGDSLTAIARFSPRSAGSVSCLLSAGPDCPTLSVQGTGTSAATISFRSDIQPIFDSNCVVCHGSNGNAGLDLRSPTSYDHLVNVPSTGYPPAVRIKAFDLNGSVLYGKVSGSGMYGQQMPPTGALRQGDQDRIRIWIEQGAADN